MPAAKMPSGDTKRGKRGPAPGHGGRPVDASRGRVSSQLALRLYDADTARIERLQALWGGSQAEVVRRAIEMADDMTRE
jgi:hypothetical protein